MTVFDAEVIVAGGGPAGSATAALLARAGHDVLLLDRARFPRPKACAEYLSPATADVLARLGALAAVEAHRPVRPLGMYLVYQEAPRALVRYPDPAVPRRALCLPRDILDATLLDHARAAGVRVPVILGGGATTDNVTVALASANGVIVSTALMRRTADARDLVRWDADAVGRFMEAAARRSVPPSA